MINWIQKKYRQIFRDIASETNEEFVRVEPNEFMIFNEVYTGYSTKMPIIYNLNVSKKNSNKLFILNKYGPR